MPKHKNNIRNKIPESELEQILVIESKTTSTGEFKEALRDEMYSIGFIEWYDYLDKNYVGTDRTTIVKIREDDTFMQKKFIDVRSLGFIPQIPMLDVAYECIIEGDEIFMCLELEGNTFKDNLQRMNRSYYLRIKIGYEPTNGIIEDNKFRPVSTMERISTDFMSGFRRRHIVEADMYMNRYIRQKKNGAFNNFHYHTLCYDGYVALGPTQAICRQYGVDIYRNLLGSLCKKKGTIQYERRGDDREYERFAGMRESRSRRFPLMIHFPISPNHRIG